MLQWPRQFLVVELFGHLGTGSGPLKAILRPSFDCLSWDYICVSLFYRSGPQNGPTLDMTFAICRCHLSSTLSFPCVITFTDTTARHH
eukprot:3695640-Pyramimonas_sp.AAC.2